MHAEGAQHQPNMGIVAVIVAVVTVNFIAECHGDLSRTLRHYETLHHSQVTRHHVERRSSSAAGWHSPWQDKIFSFDALGRHFRVHVHPNHNLFSRHLQTQTVNGAGQRSSFIVDEEDFYEGYVEGESSTSHVYGYEEGPNLVLSIHTNNDTYNLEPSWRHLANSDDYSMIAYRASDVKRESETDPKHHAGHQYCGYAKPPVLPSSQEEDYGSKVKDHKRSKRATATTNKVCSVMLVADYRFYAAVGNSDTSTTAKYLINILARVNAIYEATQFGQHSGLGFELKGIKIHEAPTSDSGTHYNMAVDTWDTAALLEAFGRVPEWADYCLAHLFTHAGFSGGVLGLAWIASPKSNEVGGLCSKPISGIYYNTAWSSTKNSYGNRILTQEAELVTAHEFGHNWGSQHDPDSADCAPSSSQGGQYLMYTYSVSGYDYNNNQFSPCSQSGIDAVLTNKAAGCLTEKQNSFCGNYKIENGEQCDAGPDGRLDKDPCCNANCQFRADQGAVCSDANSICCSNCTLALGSKVCRSTGSLLTSCERDAHCTGTSPDCPGSLNKPDGTPCIDGGECSGGVCRPYCESHGATSCKCDTVVESCQLCCRNGTNGGCAPVLPAANLTDGKSCVIGLCNSGVCHKEKAETARLWNIIENLSFNAILIFMKNNIVLSTIVVSLVLYIPLCLIVFCIDHKRSKADQAEVDWHNKNNNKLVLANDRGRIRQTYRKRANLFRASGSCHVAGDNQSNASASKVNFSTGRY